MAPVMDNQRFRDRSEAGRLLAERLREYAGRDDVVVLGLPRGGVPVAFEIARALDAPLDMFLVRKLGVPGHEELAFGAIATGGMRVLNKQVLEHARDALPSGSRRSTPRSGASSSAANAPTAASGHRPTWPAAR